MMLDYASQHLGVKIPDLDLDEIRRVVRTQDDGTLPGDAPRINRRLVPASHKVELIHSMRNTFRDIEMELEAGRPVIACIMIESEDRAFRHAVVITNIDKNRLVVEYDDPFFGRRECEVPSFLKEWEECESVLIKLRIDRKPPQKELRDFP